MGSLDGKTAVISGALGGMGRAACEYFCNEGATVIGVDRVSDGADDLVKPLRDAGATVEFRRADVSEQAEVDALVEAVQAEYGHVEILYNNAGVNLGKPLTTTTDEEWSRQFDVNVTSVFRMTRAFAPILTPGAAAIVNVSSVAAVVAFPESAAYSASKAAVSMFTKSSAVDLGPDIRVNAVLPGVIDTPMPRAVLDSLRESAADRDAVWQSWEDGAELKRVGSPAEVVALAAFLASDRASFITGAIVPVDGGWSLR